MSSDNTGTPARRIDWTNVAMGLVLAIGPTACGVYVGERMLELKFDLMKESLRVSDERAEKQLTTTRGDFQHEIDQLHEDVRELRGERDKRSNP